MNKKLLLMGGSAYAQTLASYAKEKHFTMIGVGNIPNTLHKRISSKTYDVDTQDIDSIIKIVQEEQCDGIFVGSSEANIPPSIEVAEKTGIHFYADRTSWDIMSNKKSFKDLLQQHEITTTKEYCPNDDGTVRGLAGIEYPVIVKPVDGTAGGGIKICWNDDELQGAYSAACKKSKAGKALIEKYYKDLTEMFVHYTLVDGKYSVACTFDRHLNCDQKDYPGMAVGYTYPSIFTNNYLKIIDKKMRKAFRAVGLSDGAINVQCRTDGKNFYFYEAGYRLGGEQMYFFTEKLTGINVCKMFVNYALTGRMSEDPNILEKDNPYFAKPCLSYYVPLKAGTITTMHGIEEVRKLDGVLNVTEMCGLGTQIIKDGSLSQVCMRMHIMANTVLDLAKKVDEVNSILNIKDEYGNDMMMEKFDLRKTRYYTNYEKIIM